MSSQKVNGLPEREAAVVGNLFKISFITWLDQSQFVQVISHPAIKHHHWTYYFLNIHDTKRLYL